MTEESQNQQEQPTTSPDLQPITIPSTPDLELCQQALQAVQNQQNALNEQMAADDAAMLAAAKAMDEEEANKRQNTRRVWGFLGIGFLLTAIVGLWGGKKLFSGDQGSVGGEPPPNPPKETSNGVTILPAQDNVVHVQTEKVLGNGGIETADVAFNTSEQATHIKKILENNAPAEAVLYLKEHATEMRKWGNVGGAALDNPNLENHGLGAFNGGNSKGNLADIYEKIQKNATLNGAEQGSLNNTLQRLQEATGDTSAIPGTSKEKIEKIIALKDTIAQKTQDHYDALLKPPVSRASVGHDTIVDASDRSVWSDMGNTLGVEPIPAHHGGLFHGVGDAMRGAVSRFQGVAHSVAVVAQHPAAQVAMKTLGVVGVVASVAKTVHEARSGHTALAFMNGAAAVATAAATVGMPPVAAIAGGVRVAAYVKDRSGEETLGRVQDQKAALMTKRETLRQEPRTLTTQAQIVMTDVALGTKAVDVFVAERLNESRQGLEAAFQKAQSATQTTMAVASETLSKVQDFLKAMPWFSKQPAAARD